MARSSHARKPRANQTVWRETSAGMLAYTAARAEAQTKANATGYDHGLEANDLFKTWRSWTLPQRVNRYGHEMQCEVVMCEHLDRCKPGHGPR